MRDERTPFTGKETTKETIGWGGRVSQMLFHNIHILVCVIYSFAYIKYYIIKRLKIKRKRRHKGKPKSLSDGLVCSARLSLRGSLTGPQLSWPVLASLTQHSSGPEPALRFNRESDHQSAPRSIALSSSSSVGTSGRPPATVSVISAPLAYAG